MIGKYVLVRTRSAGVHMGTLAEWEGTVVVLRNATRLWHWKGANTLSEVSQRGVAAGSKIAEEVPEILLTEAIEIIPCSAAARKILETPKWGN